MMQTKHECGNGNGFAVPLQPDTELGLAMLIAVNGEGDHTPVAIAGTIAEARDLARTDFRARVSRLDSGGDPGICPYEYKLWARGLGGSHLVACVIDPASL